MRTLNLGILAHVDAGKTTLTERLLYATGAIGRLGNVDEGTTQTDFLELERERGITIRSAVASFTVADLAVNIIDTPGHPDFIAEVERVLAVLDGAVLVVSAVEGVQPQTPLLMRALQRLRVPTLIFVNKIDRAGADVDRVVAAISRRLTPAILPMGTVVAPGTRAADFVPATEADADFTALLAETVADHDEGVLSEYVAAESALTYRRLRRLLAQQTAQSVVQPVFFGSAITGAGVAPLTTGIAELLPAARGDSGSEVGGRVFKIERSAAGEKIACVRLSAGALHVRDEVRYGLGIEGRVTALSIYAPGGTVQRPVAYAGQIARVSGLDRVRVGDAIGAALSGELHHEFPPPTLESVVAPVRPADKGRLRAALTELAEQDPLINVRQDDTRHEISVSLYGDVQKEVIGATLARDYGVEVSFRDTTTIYVERPTSVGEAVEILRARTHANVTGRSSPDSTNPFPATLGLRVEPAPIGSGVDFRVDVDVRLVPLYIYKTADAFGEQMAAYVRDALQQGLSGWQVTDCIVTLFESGYRAPGTTAGDFRKLTPLVLLTALEAAGTAVCEPMARLTIELPTEATTRLLPLLGRLGAHVDGPVIEGDMSRIGALLPAAAVRDVQRNLPAISGGEGVIESAFAGYQPVSGVRPTRRRTRALPSRGPGGRAVGRGAPRVATARS